MSFPESKTHQNLKAAFAGESQANRRYTWMAQVAEKEGLPEVAALFKHSADGETGHALKHLMFLAAQAGDPATGMPLGDTLTNLKSAVAGETYEYTDMYPEFARLAREEGYAEIAAWFETLAKVERFHAGRFQDALTKLQSGGMAAPDADIAKHI
ncbi:rubrerythrin family protein [Geothrix sp.]|jgi:rubrerythrin|uniref:rubrerythrin family protein n=1 Tax=Geothrix sp. TaxID=1962974 RepID=UPI0025BEC0CE|nr:rubrerythrin family protein [Geothrix sp.]